MREEERTEAKHNSANCCGCAVARNTLAKQAGKERAQRELQNKRKVISENSSEGQTERHSHNLAKYVSCGPRQIGTYRIQNEIRVKRVLSMSDSPGKFPKEPCMKIVVP